MRLLFHPAFSVALAVRVSLCCCHLQFLFSAFLATSYLLSDQYFPPSCLFPCPGLPPRPPIIQTGQTYNLAIARRADAFYGARIARRGADCS